MQGRPSKFEKDTRIREADHAYLRKTEISKVELKHL